jgi:demethylmenaquinone methyltransferase/2-methoxy-6-polyprenyl-1,4-benzoquinol methylase
MGGGEDQVFFGDRVVGRGEKAPLVRDVFARVASRYDLMNDLMSGGIHRAWKRAMVGALNPAPPFHMVDVAGGTGDIALKSWERIARRGGTAADSRVVVCDLTESMVGVGRDRALDRGIASGVDFVVGDAQALPFADASQDAVTIAFGIRNVADPDVALSEARRILRHGGRFLCLEFGGPVAPGIDPLYRLYGDHVLPRLGQTVSGEGDAYRYLVESIRRFPGREDFAASVAAAGLGNVHMRTFFGGIATLYSAWRI